MLGFRKDPLRQSRNEDTSGIGTNVTGKTNRDIAQEMFSKCLIGKNAEKIAQFKDILQDNNNFYRRK